MLLDREWFRGLAAICLGILLAGGCGGFKPVPLLEGDPEVLPPGVIQEHECVDFWALVHFDAGYLLAEQLGEKSLPETILLLTAYEIIEPQFWPRWGENQINQECDILFGSLGWLAWALTEDD